MGDMYVNWLRRRGLHTSQLMKTYKELRGREVPCLKGWSDQPPVSGPGFGLERLQWEDASVMKEEEFEAADLRMTVHTLRADEHCGCGHVVLCHPD